MNCPICLSIMENRDERHHVPPNCYRMNLHCINMDCLSRNLGYNPHMGVIVAPNGPWKCHEYHFPVLYKKLWYTLVGEVHFQGVLNLNKLKTTRIQRFPPNNKPIIIETDFIPISTDNDMHLQVQHTFERLMKLVIFS